MHTTNYELRFQMKKTPSTPTEMISVRTRSLENKLTKQGGHRGDPAGRMVLLVPSSYPRFV